MAAVLLEVVLVLGLKEKLKKRLERESTALSIRNSAVADAVVTVDLSAGNIVLLALLVGLLASKNIVS
jgi:hypothetical protein